MTQLKLFNYSDYGEAKLVEIPVSLCVPHELNPRFHNNEELIDRIAEQIQENRFKPEHAILVRPKDSQFQIISGHHRLLAAKKVNLENILAWVSDGMSDERAHSLLLLENDQSELSPLEKGKHAFDHIKQFDSKGGRGKTGGISEYARTHKLSQPVVSRWVSAYQVFEKTYTPGIGFEKISHKVLYEISQAPEPAWQPLVEFALSEEWTVVETAEVVKKIDGMEALADYGYSLPTIYVEALKHRGKKYQLFQNILKRIIHWQEIFADDITLYQWVDTQEEREESNQVYRKQISQSFQFNARQEFINSVKSLVPRDPEKLDDIASSISNIIKEHSIGGTERWRVEEFQGIFETLPPVLVRRIEGKLYLLDGFHRYAAAKNRKLQAIQAEIILNGRRKMQFELRLGGIDMQLTFEFRNYEFIDNFSVTKLVISPLNLRATVDDQEHIKSLAKSIGEEGYQPNRGLLVNSRNGDYRVVAGSNRLKAVQYLGRETIPVYLFKELSDEQEAKLSEQDNKLDETHKPIYFLDIAEAYKRLVENGWKQVKIAEAYDDDEGRVSKRIKIASMPLRAKQIMRGNLEQLSQGVQDSNGKHVQENLEHVQDFLVERCFYEITNLHHRDQIKIVAEVVLSQGKLKGQKLKDECNKLKYQEKLKRLVWEKLFEKKLSILREIFKDIERGIYGDGKESGKEIPFDDNALGKRIAALNEKARCRFVCGDATNPELWQEVKDKSIAVVITDPPYGIDYLTNYRIIKNDEIGQPISGDDSIGKAITSFAKTLVNLNPKMQDDSHLYVFSSWKVYPEFVHIISKDYTIKNVIAWDKGNWTAGDLDGNYGEQYEIIIFATKGNRKLCGEKRLSNLMRFPRVAGNEQIVSTQKPVDLIKILLLQSAAEKELVCDPFAGSGTLAAACSNRNPYFCIEIDEVTHKKAMRRISEC